MELTIICQADNTANQDEYIAQSVDEDDASRKKIGGHSYVFRFRSRLLQCEVQRQLLVTEKEALEEGLKKISLKRRSTASAHQPTSPRLAVDQAGLPNRRQSKNSSQPVLSRDDLDFSDCGFSSRTFSFIDLPN